MTLVPSYRSLLGIAKETVEGTAVPPTFFLRPTGMKPAIKQSYLADLGMRGAMAKTYDQVQGPFSADYEVDADLRLGEVGWFLAGVLGDVATTGSSDPYTTTFALLNSGQGQPPTYTLTDFNGENARAYAGCRFSDVSFKFAAAGLATVTAKAVGRTFATATTPVPSFSAYPVQAAWQAAVSLAGSAAVKVSDAQIDLKRTVTATPNLGIQAPGDIYADGDFDVTGTLTVMYDTALGETVYGYYLTQGALPLIVTLANGANRSLTLTMSQVQIDDATLTRGAGKYAELACKFTAHADTTDIGASAGYSPILASLKNGVAAGIYA